ncbi:MAG: CBS domain-containing protein [Planctomycetota bacterium]
MATLPSIKSRLLMKTDVVYLHALTPIERAIEIFDEYSIHGAPVVDEAGELCGVLSMTDIARRDEAQLADRRRNHNYYSHDPLEESFELRDEYPAEILGRELVSDWMTPSVLSIGPDEDLSAVAAMMAGERIHRVFVVDDGKLLGVISTLDVVECLATAQSAL